jgi:hypothetical protein
VFVPVVQPEGAERVQRDAALGAQFRLHTFQCCLNDASEERTTFNDCFI